MSLPKFNKMSKYFGDTHILKDVDLNVEESEVCVVIGPSGSGKSVLLYYVNRPEGIRDGEIYLGGQSISAADADINRLCRRIGTVFQSFNLFPRRTAWENVALAPTKVKGFKRGDIERCTDELLDRVGLGTQSNSYPNQLSGGQQQCVVIARALAMSPRMILLDEVTSVLDPELIEEVLDVMHNLADKGMMMFVVTHEMGFAHEVSNRIVLTADGETVEDSSPEVFFENPKTDRGRQFLSRLP